MGRLQLRIWLFILMGMGVLVGSPVVTVSLDHPDANYRCGEEAIFKVAVWSDRRSQALQPRGKVICKLTNDGLTVIRRVEVELSKGNPFLIKGKLQKPGFLRLQVDYGPSLAVKVWGAAYEPEKIRTATTLPKDFWSFWEKAAGIGEPGLPAVKQTKLDKGQPGFDSYLIFSPAGKNGVYGLLTVPAGATKLPALVNVPGAGEGAGKPVYRQGFVTLVMNVHGYNPCDPKKPLRQAYAALVKEKGYMYQGLESRETMYYYQAIVGISRAVRWLAAQPFVDAQRIGYYGTSQGGGFGLILGGLNRQFAEMVCDVPALCDHQGFALGRYSGWPFYWTLGFKRLHLERVTPYYDAVNFARRITGPITVCVGLADQICSPSSVYAAYNEIPVGRKVIIEGIGMGHVGGPAFAEAVRNMIKRLQTK